MQWNWPNNRLTWNLQRNWKQNNPWNRPQGFGKPVLADERERQPGVSEWYSRGMNKAWARTLAAVMVKYLLIVQSLKKWLWQDVMNATIKAENRSSQIWGEVWANSTPSRKQEDNDCQHISINNKKTTSQKWSQQPSDQQRPLAGTRRES